MRGGVALRLGLLGALALYACMVARHWFLVDDAYICMRYARNLADGHGLVFNLGERVEGYSGLLWVLWLAVFARVGANLETVAQVSLVIAGALLIAVTVRAAHRHLGLPVVAALATGLFLALSPPIVQWSSSGMEAVLAALFVMLAADELVLRETAPRGIVAGVALAALALIRIDGVGFGALLLLGALPRILASRAARKAALTAAAIMVLAVGVQLVWRNAYYGDWAPHTARIKAGFSVDRLERGVQYAGAFMLANPVFVLAAALVPLAWRARRDATILALTMCAGITAHSVFVGGDWMPFFRFFVMACPFAALLVGLAVARLLESGRKAGATALVAVMAVLAPLDSFDLHVVPRRVLESCWFRWSSPDFITETEELAFERDLNVMFERLGRGLAQFTRPGDSIVGSAVGILGYRTQLHFFDELGLVSPELLARDVPVIRANAGHDRVLPLQKLLDMKPTIAAAYVIPTAVVDANVERLKTMLPADVPPYRIERHALPPDAADEGPAELVIMRLRDP